MPVYTRCTAKPRVRPSQNSKAGEPKAPSGAFHGPPPNGSTTHGHGEPRVQVIFLNLSERYTFTSDARLNPDVSLRLDSCLSSSEMLFVILRRMLNNTVPDHRPPLSLVQSATPTYRTLDLHTRRHGRGPSTEQRFANSIPAIQLKSPNSCYVISS